MPVSFLKVVHQLLIARLVTNTALWKQTLTMLIHKRRDPAIISNHRPIGLVLTIYKLWTTILSRLVKEHTETRHLLSPQQEDYRRNKSTMNHVQDFIWL